MDLIEFLQTVITGAEGNLNISHLSSDGTDWREEWFEYPKDLDRAVSRIKALSSNNVYFSPYLFVGTRAVRDDAVTGKTIVADLDSANVLTIPNKPTVLVETSPGRHQGYWVLDTQLDEKEHELLSKRITYSIPGCDRTGWYIGKRVRVPDTTNYKYESEPRIYIVANTGKLWSPSNLEELPDPPSKNGVSLDAHQELIAKALKVDSGPQEYFAKVRSKLPPKVVTQYNMPAEDRSSALWSLMMACFRAGLSTEQTFFLARGSANNKFTNLRFNGDLELLKDVLRAKANAFTEDGGSSDVMEKVKGIRRFGGLAHEKLSYISDLVLKDMQARGQFINCGDGTSWYISKEEGKPVPILTRAESLQTILDKWYGLNPTERENAYVIGSLVTYTNGLPPVGRIGALSWYDKDTNTVLLHTGRKEVLLITKNDVTVTTNGYENIVFPWIPSQEVINPYYSRQEKKWEDILFDSAVNNVTGISVSEAKALLKVWMLMILVRNIVVARPILAIFGQPGAGKSTLFRRIYTLLFGKNRTLSSITHPEAFDFETAASPLVVFDNVDTYEKWIPDRFALAATISQVTRRKLYTNAETITLTRQAFLGITAHNPKFGREDVVDRLVLITLERLQKFAPETEIINYIYDNRSRIWGMIIQDLQRVLAEPIPYEYPQFRIEDFSRYGQWIANAVGVSKEFNSALNNITSEQKAFNLEEDQILMDCLEKYIERKQASAPDDLDRFRTPSEWWGSLEVLAKDPQMFGRQYKNGIVLGKKFWTLQNSLRTVFDIEWNYDKKRATRTWKFNKKV